MPEQPLAYFLTFTTYGTWLHGQAPGSVDRDHNQFGAPLLDSDSRRHAVNRRCMSQEPYLLDTARRAVVHGALVEECAFRGWGLWALHVRSNHVHLVVSAEREPEFVLRACKIHASKCLNEAGIDEADRKRWTVHGSTRYLWTEAAIAAKVEYTLHRQGVPMAVYEGDGQPPVWPSADNPSPRAREG